MDTPSNNENTATTPPPKKKTLFETILTSTPVLLTVVATFMIGQSSSEMTKAMYFRAVAGQNQSKSGDQWGFFQAKRIRGTIYEANVDNLLAKEEPVPISKDYLLKTADRIAAKLGGGEREKKAVAAVELLKDRLSKGMTSPNGRFDYPPKRIDKAFEVLNDRIAAKLPGPLTEPKTFEEKKEESEQAQQLRKVVGMIKDKKPESDIAKEVLKVESKTLDEAIKNAEEDADKKAKVLKNAEFVFEQIDELINHLALQINVYVKSLPADDAKSSKTDEVRSLVHELVTSYKTAHHVFTRWRYEDDSRSNQDLAFLYEARVSWSGAESDRHMERSKNFLYAMLVAQVAVIIASMALAVKLRSVVWSFATLAGLIAIAFGASVFLGMNW